MSSDDKRLCERSTKGSSQKSVISTSPKSVLFSNFVCHVAGLDCMKCMKGNKVSLVHITKLS